MRTLAVAAVMILGCGGELSSFAQAVAEAAMVHANSAAATTKAGSALGKALSNVVGANAEKMESVPTGRLEQVPHASRKTLASGKGEQSSDPLVITSIRGGSKPCTAAQPSQQAASNWSDRSFPKAAPSARAQTAPATASAAQDCDTATGTRPQYKSVVNLSFSK